MKAINFLPGNYHGSPIDGRKRGTVRLGDRSQNYCENEIVWITEGSPYSKRRKIFTAYIERILVKTIAKLTHDDIQQENPQIADIKEMQDYLSETYKTPVSETDVVTVIRFTEVDE